MIRSASRVPARTILCAFLTLLGLPCASRAAEEAAAPAPDAAANATLDSSTSTSTSTTTSTTSAPAATGVSVASAAAIPAAPAPRPLAPDASAIAGETPSRPTTCYDVGNGRQGCYERPHVYDFVLEAPGNVGRWLRDSVRPQNLPWVAGIAASTGLLIAYDQPLLDNTRKGMHHLGISGTGKQKDIIPGIPVQYPTDVGSAIYYFGDGMVPAVALTGILGFGLVASDDRALLTASHLAAGLLTTGVLCQTIKHTTGRQTPLRSTQDGGKWQWFPNQRDYMRNVPSYDAFPSGHVATLMLTMTVLHEDYPEAWWILPAGWTLMVPLMFQMMNNGVHWASDYPLGIAMGYGLGKQAASHGKTFTDARASAAAPAAIQYSFVPLPVAGGAGLAAVGTF